MAWLALPALLILLVSNSAVSWPFRYKENAQRRLLQSTSSMNIQQLLAAESNLETLRSLVQVANLSQLLSSNGSNITVFAPTDSAIANAIANKNVICQTNYNNDQPCSALSDLLNSTSLQHLLLNHIVRGSWWSANFTNGLCLETMGGAVLEVVQTSVTAPQFAYTTNLITQVGNASIIQADVRALNGVVHLIQSFPCTNAAYNNTMIATLELAGDFGPFSDIKRSVMASNITQILIPAYQDIRPVVDLPDGGLQNPMPILFDPTLGLRPVAANPRNFSYLQMNNVTRPTNDDDVAYMPVLQLAALIRTKQISSVDLTSIFQKRLKRYDPTLECVITFTDELAHEQATAADALLAKGTYLGPLHGIPYGLKDLMAVPGYLTTWGAASFQNQYLNDPAHVYTRLQAAGAVLIAKLATGEMAYDDVWFDGFTKNPWNIAQGSSGSSAGPAAATSAGLVPFALGTETGGSIIYPANTCGITALRPSFGLIGRSNIMSLAESMDKVGPFARSAADVAVVMDAIRGRDPADPSSSDTDLEDPFSINVQSLTVGVLDNTPTIALKVLGDLGVQLNPVTMNYTAPAESIYNVIINSEAAAHFDHWQRAGLDDLNKRQDLWPEALRNARVIPAVEYIQANRARTVLIQQMRAFFLGNAIDVLIGPPVNETFMGNVVGLPEMVIPVAFNPVSSGSPRQQPSSIGIYALPNHDSKVLALAMAYQAQTGTHLMRPPIDQVEPNILAQCLQYSRCGRAEQYNSSLVVNQTSISDSG